MANINKQKKYHFIYKTTFLPNGKYYVGMHSTNNLNDGYLGSGTRLLRMVRKYGKDKFKCEVLEYYNTRDELATRERDLITEDLINNPMCLNLQPGGGGGVSREVGLALAKAGAEAQRRLRESGDEEYLKKCKRNAENKKLLNKVLWEKGAFDMHYGHTRWVGKKHKPESIVKMQNAAKGRGIGDTNTQFGTFWITNGIENKKLKVGTPIPKDYIKGRVLKQKEENG